MRRCVRTEAVALRVSKLYDIEVDEDEGELAKIAASRVRIFPFGDVPSSMPSVGTRRSTRVFVPKSVKTSPDVDTVRVLRSGKRLLSDTAKTHGEDDDWLKLLGSPRLDAADFRRWKRENRWRVSEMAEAECYPTEADNSGDSGDSGDVCGEKSVQDVRGVLPANVDQERRFGIVYSRKRRRTKDRMYGIQFVRKQRRKKGLAANTTETGKLCNCLRGFVCRWASLVVFVRFSRTTLMRFEKFFITVLRWMKRCQLRLAEFAAFLLSESMSVVFSQHGIHFSVQCNLKDRIPYAGSCGDTISTDGICTVYGACQSFPSVSVNFSALPCFFMNLHVDILMRSFYLSRLFEQYLQSLLQAARGDIIIYTDWISCYLKNIHQRVSASSTNSSMRNAIHNSNKAINVTSENIPNRKRVKFRRYKKRRLGRGARHPLANSGLNELIKLPSVADSMIGTVVGRSCATYNNDLFDGKDRFSIYPSSRLNGRQRKSVRNSSSEKLKELKSALVDLKQNVDTIRCAANVLVIQSDMCRRECGAEVTLESSNSKEWWLAVKTQGITRYMHKAQEMRSSTCNRFTHAMMWAAEDGWKLEFCDRKDWMVFKELHRECRERNLQVATAVRAIPVPGVREVVGYGDGDNFQFVRPDVYISVKDDEIQRALLADSLYYDMDSGDEDWLEQLNCDVRESGNPEDSHDGLISKDNFEKIMYAFEKVGYSHPDDISEESKALSLCPDLGRRELLKVIFDYWLKKRKEKKASLVRVFQAPPLKRAQLVQKPIFRKKRSFKRQATQVGQSRTESSVIAGAKEDALRRVQEAEQAAKKAMDLATAKRSRAQMLMHNADLLTYKSVMAARIAEAAQLGESRDAVTSSIFC